MTVPALSVAAVVLVGARWFYWFRANAGALGNDELAHHSVVFMQQQMAVEHVRRRVIGVVLEPHDQPIAAPRLQVDRVLTAGKFRWWRRAIYGQDLELHVMDVEVVPERVPVGDLPDLGRPQLSDLVDTPVGLGRGCRR